jgi:hypothetical protein
MPPSRPPTVAPWTPADKSKFIHFANACLSDPENIPRWTRMILNSQWSTVETGSILERAVLKFGPAVKVHGTEIPVLMARFQDPGEENWLVCDGLKWLFNNARLEKARG